MQTFEHIKKWTLIGSFPCVLLAGTTLQADERSGWVGQKAYLGIGASAARLDNAEVFDNDVSTGDLTEFSDDRITGQAYAGVMFTPWIGVEGGYLHLPEYEDKGFEITGHGLSASLLLTLPIGDSAEVYVKGGQVWWDVDADGPLGFDAKIDGEDLLYGIGANFGLSDNLGIRIEYVQYKLDGGDGKADLDTATVGLHIGL